MERYVKEIYLSDVRTLDISYKDTQFELRISKSETNSKFASKITKTTRCLSRDCTVDIHQHPVLNFCILSLGFVSNFVPGYSNFLLEHAVCYMKYPALPEIN